MDAARPCTKPCGLLWALFMVSDDFYESSESVHSKSYCFMMDNKTLLHKQAAFSSTVVNSLMEMKMDIEMDSIDGHVTWLYGANKKITRYCRCRLSPGR